MSDPNKISDGEHQEGVIQFRLNHQEQAPFWNNDVLVAINRPRTRLKDAGLLGQDPARYAGLGFGNLSMRYGDGRHTFLVSGTQTGTLESLSRDDLALVTAAWPDKNALQSLGRIKPSSEAMTHAVCYQLSDSINAVVHVHAPDIWLRHTELGLASTGRHVPYGTPEMANAIRTLAQNDMSKGLPWLCRMAGHQDGILCAGKDLDACTKLILQLHEKVAGVSEQGIFR